MKQLTDLHSKTRGSLWLPNIDRPSQGSLSATVVAAPGPTCEHWTEDGQD